MKRFSLIAVFLFALTLCANTFGAVDKSEKTLVTKTRTDGDFSGITTTVKIKWYKSDDRCYITITGPISDFTSDEIAIIKNAINDGADLDANPKVPYTSIDLNTKNSSGRYQFTQNDLKTLFGVDKDDKSGILRTTTDIKVLSLKDANFDPAVVLDGTAIREDNAGYGWYIGLLPALEELTVSKYCDGPGMTQAEKDNKTIKKLIVPKKGDAETAMASVGIWKDYLTLEAVDLNTSIKPSGIVDNAFHGCSMLSNVKIMSNNITSIGAMAFRKCYSLSKISLPYNLTTIGADAFYGCYLKNINFPQTLTTIGANAFRDNPYVRTLKIPASVETIGDQAFAEMPELDNVYIYGVDTKAAKDAFGTAVVCDNFEFQKYYGVTTPKDYTSLVTQSDDDKYIIVDHTKWNNGTYKKTEKIITPTTNEKGVVTAVTVTDNVIDANAMLQPATLHILDNDVARTRYMNSYLQFLRNSTDVEALITSYQEEMVRGESEGNKHEPQLNKSSDESNLFAAKLDEFEVKYPRLKTQYGNDILSYFKHIYYEEKPDLKVATDDGEGNVTYNDYYKGTRPWINVYESAESSTVVKRVPYQSSGSQFPEPYQRDAVVDGVITADMLQTDYKGFNQFLVVLDDAQSAVPEIPVPEKWLDSKWYSICVPWPLTRYQVEETFGTTTEVCEFTKVVKHTDGSFSFYFTDEVQLTESGEGDNRTFEYMLAYHPYMIHPSETWEQVKIEGHNRMRVILGIDGTEFVEGSTTLRHKLVALVDSTANPVKSLADQFEFIGRNVNKLTDNNTEGIAKGEYFWAYTKSNGVETNNGSFYYNKGQDIPVANTPKYVGIIKYNGGGSDPVAASISSGSSNNGAKAVFELDDDYEYVEEPTGVRVVVHADPKQSETVRVYNINGQYVGSSLEGLSKGIYIMNGKKYVVK